MVLQLAAAFFFGKARVQWRPVGEVLGLLPFLSFLVVCFLSAGAEELVFRNTPIALAGHRKTILAFFIPTLVFILIHFITPNHAFSFLRALELFSAALLFFVVASDKGLLASTVAHTAFNLGLFLTEGNWALGAVANIHWAGSNESYLIGNCLSLWGVTLVYVLLWARAKQKRSLPRDFTLRLTST